MEAFIVETGVAAVIPGANIDTDVIMPKQFLKGTTRQGLARGLFYDLRFDQDGFERPDFILNRPEFRAARFLIVGPNFGCGSSREHAVWGLQQFGIRVVLGSTFGGIFYDNCFQNGLLPIKLEEAQLRVLAMVCAGGPCLMTIDLVETTITVPPDLNFRFVLDPLRRQCLIQGVDAIDMTLQHSDSIVEFERRYFAEAPWIRPHN